MKKHPLEDDEVLTEPGILWRGVYRLLRAMALALARVYWRLEIHGQERVPATGAFVLAPVHRSNIDFALAAMCTTRRMRFMAKSSIFVGGVIDKFFYAVGAFPVQRDVVDREALRRSEEMLASGQPVVQFPEGRRKEGPRVHELLDGPAFVACRQRVPIVPVAFAGSDEAMPLGSKILYPRKVVIVIGEPIYPDVELDGRVPRSSVTLLSQQLREVIQDLYDEAKALR